ncbi:MAG: RNA-binding transcriptional accessory protein [Candidatus Zixiibacteriota bacterium]|nr:MAG: RNA-binding transcriptional accessory protein [candidate division Zixibacteria bacterium]
MADDDANNKEISIFKKISTELDISPRQVEVTVGLLDQDATIPFIARYRKEATGELDEVAITFIRDRISKLRELEKRRAAIIKSLEERELMTDELRQLVAQAETLSELEDVYLPYKPKKRTRATIAREKGLEPLAELIFEQGDIDPEAEAERYIDKEKGVATLNDALAGARDIIAEWVNEDTGARGLIRELFSNKATIKSKLVQGKEEEGTKYSDYFDWEEPLAKAPSHRILAMRRGENESILNLKIAPPDEDALYILYDFFVDGDNPASEQVRLAVDDGYNRLMEPSIENEFRSESKLKADIDAIRIFSVNLRELLMAPPLGAKKIMAIDPGFRTGCKVVCLDNQGKLLHHTTIFPHNDDENKLMVAQKEIKELCGKYSANVIAVGNGTAGRETEAFLRNIGLPDDISIVMVNESGASVYSASEAAREEFPDYDVTVRGAVSIGRRLMDPLAELVKIDPKSIGVGQYQHDVDQSALKQGLDDAVMSCVNSVGVEINTASKQLLTFVSGLGPQLAGNIVKYRDEKGPFKSREDLKKVPRLGPKAFEQAAGFLRVPGADNPLDSSAVHPESYSIVENMAADLKCTVKELMKDEDLRKKIDLNKYVSKTIGLPTLKDIMEELARPGRDPRPEFVQFKYDDRVNSIEDLQKDMILPGIITNITAFGAFVDVGVHHDGLVHKSRMGKKFVENVSGVVKVGQTVKVKVADIDLERKRISLELLES